MNKKIHILYVVNAKMPNERANGVQIAHTCEGIGDTSIDLTLVTRYVWRTTSAASFFNLRETFSHTRIPVIDIVGMPFRYAIRNASFFISVNTYLFGMWCFSLFTRRKIVVYVRGETVLALIPLSYLIPIFFETHQIRNFEGWYKIALHRMRGIVVITERLKQKFIEEYALPQEKILVARDAVDLAVFTTTSPDTDVWQSHGIAPEKKIVLYSGTLSAEKGVYTLAKAAELLPDDVQVVFLGGTNEQVCTFKEKYGQVKNISILGRVDYVAVPKYVVSADVLVLPDSANFTYSNLYTSPMKLFEYMASKRPLVASKVPSLCEVLDEASALFFESDNPHSLAYAIQDSLTHTVVAKNRAEKAYETVSAFTWEKRTKSIVAHILERIQ